VSTIDTALLCCRSGKQAQLATLTPKVGSALST